MLILSEDLLLGSLLEQPLSKEDNINADTNNSEKIFFIKHSLLRYKNYPKIVLPKLIKNYTFTYKFRAAKFIHIAAHKC